MEIAGLLFNEIAVLFLIMGLGFLLVKTKVLKSTDSRILSMVLIWLINPAVVLKAFQIDFTPEVRDRFLLAVGVAVAVNLLLMLITWGYGKLLKLDAVERTSIMYANAGNLVVIKCLSGCANAAAEAIDISNMNYVVGTVAGDNTILIIVDDEKNVPALMKILNDMME